MSIELRAATLEQPIIDATRHEPNAGRGLTTEQKRSAAEQAAASAAQRLNQGVAPTDASGASQVATMAGKPAVSASVMAAMSGQLEAPKRYIVRVDDSDHGGPNVYYKAITNPRPGETIYRGAFAPYQVESGLYGEHSETRYRPVGEIRAEKYQGTPGKDVEVF